MVPEDELKQGEIRLLETDLQVVLPIRSSAILLITSLDVLHS